jgi:5'-nucleotidase
MTKPILLIDMDGVIADFYGHFLSIWREKYPDRVYVKPEDVTAFYLETLYPAEYSQDILDILRAPGFFANLPPMPGAIEALKKLDEEGKFEIYLCSTPDSDSVNHNCASEKMRWVERHLGKKWVKDVILTHDKTLVQGDFLIDDKPNINGLRKPSWMQIMFQHAYNKDVYGFHMNGWDKWPGVEEYILDIVKENNLFEQVYE